MWGTTVVWLAHAVGRGGVASLMAGELNGIEIGADWGIPL